MGKILLKNIVSDGVVSDILIADDRIASVSPAGYEKPSGHDEECEVVDCTGMTAMPGLVNMHTHAAIDRKSVV